MKKIGAILWIAAVVAGAAQAANITVFNSSFESPNTSFLFTNPSIASQGGSGWAFVSAPGLSSGVDTESDWGGIVAPNGTQAGYIQATSIGHGSAIDQTLTGFIVGDSYVVDFFYATPVGSNGLTFNVTLGGDTLESYTPSTGFVEATTSSVTANAASMLLDFNIPSAPGSFSEALIDSVTVTDVTATATPEPGSLVLLGLGIAGCAIWKRRRAQA